MRGADGRFTSESRGPLPLEVREKIRQAALKQHAEGRGSPRRKGQYKPTVETIEKIKQSKPPMPKGDKSPRWKGGKPKCLGCGKQLGNYNIKRCYLCVSHKGELNAGWKGGVVPENKRIRRSKEFFEWKQAVFERDGYKCQKYGDTEYLHAHHILNFAEYPELRFILENGITLSRRAHNEFHAKYGRKANTRDQLEEFIGRKL